jgi:hypothetical protein
MRSAPLIAAGIAFAVAGHALAASPTGPAGSTIPSDTQTQSAHQDSTTSTAPQAGPSTSAPSGSAADTSATTAAPASLSIGEPVKDNTGATIGAIASLNTAANGTQMAVIKMGNDTFQVPGDRLGMNKDSATINLSQTQITAMIHPAAGGK